MQDFEKLGVFYLGREYDLKSGRTTDRPVLYDSRDLVTHAVCLGMTGSGKTGLCLSLLEEAAIDGVPVIAIDPKGDLGNLLLTFPKLAPEDFRPWIDEDEARRAGVAPDAYAAAQAETWRKGLADWGQDGGRIERLRKAADFAIYTPGSRAGVPISVLSSLAAPPPGVRDAAEAMGERAGNTAVSLLSLAGADPTVRGPQHTLVATVLMTAWKAGRDLDLAALIQQVQSPPFQKIGVVDLESFFPSKDRFDLAMKFNAVLAAPGFEQWFDGEPLDPSRLLYTAEGKPRVAVCSIAHLGDAERMFFVSLLLNQMLAWMRAQTGTTSLRAVLYMDEIAGYFPPVANPPSKGPLLTLLKQGRAFGLGVVLASQNPVDLDYKGLANTGTWFLGRLQTERDKERVLEGLQGVTAGSLDRADADRMLSALGKRVFLLHDVHAKGPVVFQTRWTLSYLRGPLSRDQIRALTAARPAPGAPQSAATPAAAAPAPKTAAAAPSRPPVLAPQIQQFFIPSAAGQPAAVYSPAVLGVARVSFADAKLGISETRDVVYAASIAEGAIAVDWAEASRLDVPASDLRQEPESADVSFLDVPTSAAQAKNYAIWQKAFSQWLAQTQKIELLRHQESGLTSKAGESERDFRIRVGDAQRAARDAALDRLRKKYAGKQGALAERLRKARSAVERESDQASQQKLQTALSVGASFLGALLSGKTLSTANVGRATTAARGMGRSMKEASDVKRASESVEAVQEQMTALESEVLSETQALTASFDALVVFETVALTPKRGQVAVQFVALAWDPS